MALGSVGWVMPGVKSSERFYSYRYSTDKGGLFLPDKRYGIPVPVLQEVGVRVCGVCGTSVGSLRLVLPLVLPLVVYCCEPTHRRTNPLFGLM